MFAILLRLLSGDKRDEAPRSPISLSLKSSKMLVRLLRFLRGDKRD